MTWGRDLRRMIYDDFRDVQRRKGAQLPRDKEEDMPKGIANVQKPTGRLGAEHETRLRAMLIEYETSRRLAKVLGTSQETIEDLLSGGTRMRHTLDKLAAAIDANGKGAA